MDKPHDFRNLLTLDSFCTNFCSQILWKQISWQQKNFTLKRRFSLIMSIVDLAVMCKPSPLSVWVDPYLRQFLSFPKRVWLELDSAFPRLNEMTLSNLRCATSSKETCMTAKPPCRQRRQYLTPTAWINHLVKNSSYEIFESNVFNKIMKFLSVFLNEVYRVRWGDTWFP